MTKKTDDCLENLNIDDYTASRKEIENTFNLMKERQHMSKDRFHKNATTPQRVHRFNPLKVVAVVASVAVIIVGVFLLLPFALENNDTNGNNELVLIDNEEKDNKNSTNPEGREDMGDACKDVEYVAPSGDSTSIILNNPETEKQIDFSGNWQKVSQIEKGKTIQYCLIFKEGHDENQNEENILYGEEHLKKYDDKEKYIIIEREDDIYEKAYEVYEIMPNQEIRYSDDNIPAPMEIFPNGTGNEYETMQSDSGQDIYPLTFEWKYIVQGDQNIGIDMYSTYNGVGWSLIYIETLENGNVLFEAIDRTGGDSSYDIPFGEGYYDQPFKRVFEFRFLDEQ